MNYTLNQLQIFLKVSDLQSVTRAAEELHMTQPAVSIQLRNFQDQFDVPLFEIIKKRLYVTDFGKEIASLARKILQDIDYINLQTQAFKGLLAGRLKISSASTGKYIIPYFLNDFLNAHPEIDVTLDVTNKTRVIQSLIKNEIDFALISVVPEGLDTDQELLMDNKLYLIGPTHGQQSQLPLIYREEGSATRAAMETFFGKTGNQQKTIELTSNEAVKQAVIAGLGQSIVPLIGLRNELTNGDIKILPHNGLPRVTQWRLVWLKEKKLSPVANAYLAFIRKEKERIRLEKFGWYIDFK